MLTAIFSSYEGHHSLPPINRTPHTGRAKMCRLTSRKCGSSLPPPSASLSPALAAATGSAAASTPPSPARSYSPRPLPQEAPLLIFEVAPTLSPSSSPTSLILLHSESSPLPSSSRSAGLLLTPSPPPHSPSSAPTLSPPPGPSAIPSALPSLPILNRPRPFVLHHRPSPLPSRNHLEILSLQSLATILGARSLLERFNLTREPASNGSI